MKVLAVILLVVAAVQARSTRVQKSLPALGENPSVVHLRLAVSTSGYLNSCVGSLISDRWALTSRQCVNNARFIWVRYGVVEVIKPSFVTETSAVSFPPNSDVDLALVSINRQIETTDNIAPIDLATDADELSEAGKVCGFGQQEDGSAGQNLRCVSVTVSDEGALLVASSDEGEATKYDIGAALVVDGKQVGVLSEAKEGGATFVKVADNLDWIKTVTGLELSSSGPEDKVKIAYL